MAVAIMSDIVMKDPGLSQRNIEILSAGTGAIGGQAAHPNARETMREWGLILDNHVSSPLSSGIVGIADLIVALDTYVKDDIIISYPASLQKIYTLNIADPYGQSLEAYRRCAQDIRDGCISKVLPLIGLLYQPA